MCLFRRRIGLASRMSVNIDMKAGGGLHAPQVKGVFVSQTPVRHIHGEKGRKVGRATLHMHHCRLHFRCRVI